MKPKNLIFVMAALAVLCLLTSSRASAQNVYAAIHGTVTDPSGAVVPDATVTVVNNSTGSTTKATTDSKGYYLLPQLAAGGPIHGPHRQNRISDLNDRGPYAEC